MFKKRPKKNIKEGEKSKLKSPEVYFMPFDFYDSVHHLKIFVRFMAPISPFQRQNSLLVQKIVTLFYGTKYLLSFIAKITRDTEL